MPGKKIKKIAILFPKKEFGNILIDLISNDLVEVSEPELQQGDDNLDSLITKEVINIEQYDANQESLTLLATETALYLTGWIWSKSEKALEEILSKYTCAWEANAPTDDELENAPIILLRPGFLYGLYKGHRDLFYPLGKKDDDDDE